MNKRRTLARAVLCAAPLWCLAAGCASLKAPNWLARADKQKREERRTAAETHFDEGRDQAEFQSALQQWSQGDEAACEQTLSRLLERSPEHRQARLLLAELCLTQHRTGQALREAADAARRHPDDAQATYTLGLALDAAERGDEALACYRRAAELEPQNELYALGYRLAMETAESVAAATGEQPGHTGPPAEAGLAEAGDRAGPVEPASFYAADPATQAIGRGRAALAAGVLDEALRHFRQAAALRPGDPQVPIAASLISLQAGQPELAVAVITEAESRLGASAELKRVLAVAHYRRGDYRSSQVALQQALSLDNASALSYFLMGCTLAKLGQVDQAEAHFRQAQLLDPRYATQR